MLGKTFITLFLVLLGYIVPQNTLAGERLYETTNEAKDTVKFNKIDVKQPVFEFIKSDDGKYVCFALRDKRRHLMSPDIGEIRLYKVEDMSLVWKYSFNYSTDGAMMTGKGLLATINVPKISKKLANFIDFNAGDIVWCNDMTPVYKNDSLDLVLGFSDQTNQKIEAYKMSSGTKLWTSDLSCNVTGDLMSFLPWGRDKLIVISDRLYMVDLNTGNLLKKKITSHRLNVGATVGMFAGATLGALLGAAIGRWMDTPGIGMPLNIWSFPFSSAYMLPTYDFYYIPTSKVNYGLISNIVTDGKYLYLSDNQKLYCINEKLEEKWSCELPPKAGSMAVLKLIDGKLHLYNLGIAVMQNSIVSYRRPSVAEFDTETGRCIRFKQISDDRTNVCKVLTMQGGDCIVTKDKLAYNTYGDSLRIEDWDAKEKGKITDVTKSAFYVLSDDGRTLQAVNTKPSHIAVATDKDSIFVIDDNANISAAYHADKTGMPYPKGNGIDAVRLLDSKAPIFIRRHDGTVLMKFDSQKTKIKLIGRRLIVSDSDGVRYTDL